MSAPPDHKPICVRVPCHRFSVPVFPFQRSLKLFDFYHQIATALQGMICFRFYFFFCKIYFITHSPFDSPLSVASFCPLSSPCRQVWYLYLTWNLNTITMTLPYQRGALLLYVLCGHVQCSGHPRTCPRSYYRQTTLLQQAFQPCSRENVCLKTCSPAAAVQRVSAKGLNSNLSSTTGPRIVPAMCCCLFPSRVPFICLLPSAV